MAKIGLTKLGLKVNTEIINFAWGEENIELKRYLPIQQTF